MLELIIQNGDKIFIPSVVEGVEWSTERTGSCGKLTFKVVKDEYLNFVEGNSVRLKYNDTEVFYGFVFTKKRTDNDTITVTAYDQLRYLKNKDTYVIENKTLGETVRMIAEDFRLKVGDIADTKYKIASMVEDNQTLFDIIGDVADETLTNTGEMYVLYDDFGKLTLKNVGDMKTDLVITQDTAQSIDYTSSIDTDTYNQIKLISEDSNKTRNVYMVKDSNHINDWGVLQYYEKIKEGENGKAKAESLLKLYNNKTRKLTIRGAIGDLSVRAGTLLPVIMNIGDMVVSNYLLVESCKHTFNLDEHTMELKMRGGDFNV